MDRSRLGFSTASLAGHSLAEAARIGRELGFRTIELLAFDGYRHSQGDLAGFYFDRLSAKEREGLRRLVEPFEWVSTHAPFLDIPLFAPNPGIREEARRQIRVAIEATAFLGGSTCTAHACGKSGREPAEYWDEMVTAFRSLGDCAGEAGITLTLETGHPVGVEAFTRLIRDIDHPAVGANIDVGHLVGALAEGLRGTPAGQAQYRRLVMAQLDALGAKVFHFHLHDLRPADFRDHRAVGRGFLDFAALMARCRRYGYEGLWVLELEEPDLLPALAESRAALEAAMEPGGLAG